MGDKEKGCKECNNGNIFIEGLCLTCYQKFLYNELERAKARIDALPDDEVKQQLLEKCEEGLKKVQFR